MFKRMSVPSTGSLSRIAHFEYFAIFGKGNAFAAQRVAQIMDVQHAEFMALYRRFQIGRSLIKRLVTFYDVIHCHLLVFCW